MYRTLSNVVAIFTVNLILFLGVGSCVAQDSILRWKFVEGDSYIVQLGQSSSLNSVINNRKVATDQDVQVQMEWKVDIVEDKKARMTWRFMRVYSKSSSVKIKTVGGDGESPIPDVIEFDTDSEQPKNEAAAKLWKGVKPLIDQPFKVTMSDQGEITGGSIPPETMEILREFPGSMRIRQLMTEDGIKEVFGRTSIILPIDAIGEGHTWNEERRFEIPLGKIKQSTSYSYKGKQQAGEMTGHLIEADSKAEVDSMVKDGRPELNIDSQTSTGKLWFDADAGLMKSAIIESSMQTTTPYRDMEIKAEMKSQLSLKVEKQ